MSRTRRLVIHAFLVAGFWTFAFMFNKMSVGSASQGLMVTAAVACILVGVAFAARLATIARGHSPAAAVASAAPPGGALTRDWRTWCLAAWVVVCLAASASEMLGEAVPDAPRLLSPLSMALLVALFAWQAFRTMSMERRLQGS